MARKKAPEKPANHERWLVSYGDFITLLFAVFVTLYAMSQTDKKKVNEVAASYRSAFGISSGAGVSIPNVITSSELMPIPALDTKAEQAAKSKKQQGDVDRDEVGSDAGKKQQVHSGDFQDIKKSIKITLKPLQLAGALVVEDTSQGIAIRLEEAVFFEPGSATVKPEALNQVGKIASALASVTSHQLRIEGHTDNLPPLNSRYQTNWELSLDRAANIMRIFLENYDFTPANISIAGYGEFRPVADNDTESGRKKNRRVDIILMAVKSDRPIL
jgi:chemotaxis protein MotB